MYIDHHHNARIQTSSSSIRGTCTKQHATEIFSYYDNNIIISTMTVHTLLRIGGLCLLLATTTLVLGFSILSDSTHRTRQSTTTVALNAGRRDFLSGAGAALIFAAATPGPANALTNMDYQAGVVTWDGAPLNPKESKTADDLFSKLMSPSSSNSTSTKK